MIDRVRTDFRRQAFVKLPAFLGPELLETVLSMLASASYYERIHRGIGVERCVVPGPLTGTLELLMNDPLVFDAIRSLTDCEPIGCFEGRVYELAPTAGHYDSWHNDVAAHRMIALSVNLGRERFEGGVLQFRRAHDETVLAQVENRIAGDAVMFKVDPAYCHRVGPVTGEIPRTVYAGWFRSEPSFQDLLRARFAGAV